MHDRFIAGQIDNADFKGAAGPSLDSDMTMKLGLDKKNK